MQNPIFPSKKLKNCILPLKNAKNPIFRLKIGSGMFQNKRKSIENEGFIVIQMKMGHVSVILFTFGFKMSRLPTVWFWNVPEPIFGRKIGFSRIFQGKSGFFAQKSENEEFIVPEPISGRKIGFFAVFSEKFRYLSFLLGKIGFFGFFSEKIYIFSEKWERKSNFLKKRS